MNVLETTIHVIDLGRMPYRKAWAVQEDAHANVLAGEKEMILTVEHAAVITVGRRTAGFANLVSRPDQLEKSHVELVHSDRGGDITLHSPGQIVVYPILRLAERKLSAGGYVHKLEATVIEALGEFGIRARTDPAAIGVWTAEPHAAKICAIGVRIRRGVSLHGLALNVCNDLSLFNHIIPCGLAARPVTSISKLLAGASPTLEQVKSALISRLVKNFGNAR